ncbi:hypothetical protein O181_073996 [Austropuccinia psidii MF-1]|uniref:Uncharacterized protein n=1 Tax=Austropuccinia psidii MF-1 TaxID=1389203 RepID=A0A9Q3I8T8_9BASI|nr:hypothetical protein [Austropuccinia psidii MF-1]
MLPHPCLIFSLAYNPYTAEGPSSYASDTALTPPYASSHLPHMPPTLLTILMLAVPSQHASNPAYHPYACSVLPTCLRPCLPSLPLQSPPNMPPTPLTILTLRY